MDDKVGAIGYPSEEEKQRRLLQGLADVDAGRTVPHAEVVAWVRLMTSRDLQAAARDQG